MKSAVFSRPVTVAVGAAMLLAASVVQAFQATPPVTLQSLAGHYQGHAKWSEGEAKVAADLRFAGGKVTGSLDSGEGPIAIVGATVSGDQVVWVLDMNGSPGRISGRLTNGRLEGEWANLVIGV